MENPQLAEEVGENVETNAFVVSHGMDGRRADPTARTARFDEVVDEVAIREATLQAAPADARRAHGCGELPCKAGN